MKDYQKIGLKAGLEIHQQLDTGKLFCNCPGYLRNDNPEYVVDRKLHAVAGESGEVDVAVEYEASLDKVFEYEGYSDNVCLIDLDEEPPRMINDEALNVTLQICLLMNCEVYPYSQIMRKTVINGSNTSGFQRTVMIGHDGFIETEYGKLGIESIALEEDSARIIDKDDKKVKYRLDRLGIPLIEITTKPELYTPEAIKAAALKIGEILRACKVKRGIGTIRQDLNISIKGHDRVEIKGFQDPRIMIKTVDLEIERQQEEVKEKKKNGEVRNARDDGTTEFLRPMPGRARMYPETDLPLLRVSRERLNLVKKNLPKLKAEIKAELEKKGLEMNLIDLVLDLGTLEEFNVLVTIYRKDANLVGKMVSLWRQEFASKYKRSFEEVKGILHERLLEQILEKLSEGEIEEGDVRKILIDIMEGKSFEEAIKIEKISHDSLEEEIRKIVQEKPGLRHGAYMGLIIQKLGTNVDKRKAMELLNKITG